MKHEQRLAIQPHGGAKSAILKVYNWWLQQYPHFFYHFTIQNNFCDAELYMLMLIFQIFLLKRFLFNTDRQRRWIMTMVVTCTEINFEKREPH